MLLNEFKAADNLFKNWILPTKTDESVDKEYLEINKTGFNNSNQTNYCDQKTRD